MGKKHEQAKEYSSLLKETRIGQWVNGQKQGEFEILYKDGNKMTTYRDDEEVNG